MSVQYLVVYKIHGNLWTGKLVDQLPHTAFKDGYAKLQASTLDAHENWRTDENCKIPTDFEPEIRYVPIHRIYSIKEIS